MFTNPWYLACLLKPRESYLSDIKVLAVRDLFLDVSPLRLTLCNACAEDIGQLYKKVIKIKQKQ